MYETQKNNRRIDAVERVTIGEIDQWISIRTQDSETPIILFLHGGPGSAQIMFSRKSQIALEKDFVVVNWDQRGAGKSFSKNLRKEEMTIDRFVLDAEILIEYLLKRFNQKKLFLVGHSWGSIIGIKITKKRPDMICAYIGIGQVVNMSRGEEISYRFTLNEAKMRNNKRAIKQLQTIGYPPYKDLSSAGVQRNWLSKFNGATYKGTAIGTIIKNLTWKDISILDIMKFIKGAIFSLPCLEDQTMKIDFMNEIKELNVPVFFCSGRRDYNVPFELVAEYMENLIAPEKELLWFEKSAHLPNFEEPEKFCRFCCDLKAKICDCDVLLTTAST
jgi:pimeloyl-ACP methyl ester carboxylesterase